ncbi:MAG: family 20 glycosylhydrolase, partial [Lentisphaerae bacterium]|nr:family 20 glycosylhydrolase [Lentisphaerota bacterium]
DFTMQSTEWTQHTYPLGRCWNRGKKRLDTSKLVNVYVNPGQADVDFLVDHVELLRGSRSVHLVADRVAFAGEVVAKGPVIDGDLSDACWQGREPLGPFTKYGVGGPATDQTNVRITYDETSFYIGVVLHSAAMDKLVAEETARDAAVWRDDCLEVFVDADHTHERWHQFVTNALGSQFDGTMPGGEEGRGVTWNGAWQVKTRKQADAWTVEMAIPFEDVGGKPDVGTVWGFNVCREAPSTKELSMWTDTGGRFTRVQGLADLVFGKTPEGTASVESVRLEEHEPGRCTVRMATRNAGSETKGACKVTVQMRGMPDVTHEKQVTVVPKEGELVIPVEFPVEDDGEAKLLVQLCDEASGNLVYYRGFTFKISLPSEADLDELVLVPSPQELVLGKGAFALPEAGVFIQVGDGERDRSTGGVIQRELAGTHGVRVPVRRHCGPWESGKRILLGRPETLPAIRDGLKQLGLADKYAKLPAEGHIVSVTPEQVILAGKDARGTYYAARTFLQLVAYGARNDRVARAPACTIVDWPEMPFRGYMIFTSGWPQDPHDSDVLKEFIYKQIAGYKYNTIVWQMKAGYHYSSYPRLANRCALSKQTVREVAEFAREHFLEIIPNTNILGHSNWIVLKYKELMEDGKPHQICTRHPQIYPMLHDILEEMLDVFGQPKRLHVGLDEVRWKTYNLPEEERCERCRGVPKWQIYADHINALHGFLAEKGVETWVWGDMLLPRHNGGPPFDCAKALDLIPKDVVICNWSAEYAAGSSRMLKEKGFTVVKSNSRQVPASERPHVIGNLASFWYRHPWCPMSQGGERGLMLETAYAAEYSWHVNEDDVSLSDFRREKGPNVLRLAARPSVPKGSSECVPIALADSANWALGEEACIGDGTWADGEEGHEMELCPGGAIRVGDTSLTVDPASVVALHPGASEIVPLALRERAASLVFLHTALFPKETAARKAYLKDFLAPNEGVPIVTVRVTYSDGQTAEIPIRVGMEVGSWLPQRTGEYLVRCPYLVRVQTPQAKAQESGKADAVLYTYEWPNPRPGTRIDQIAIKHNGEDAAYALLGLSRRSLQE